MKKQFLRSFLFFLLFVILQNLASVNAQDVSQDSTSNPLQYFEHLVGGVWESDKTRQTFKWGIGKKSVVSKLYFVDADSLKLVGEITWFWHPGEKKIRGYGTSIDMAMDFFDYTTVFESPYKMLNTFMGYGGNMDGVPQLETLEFIEDNKYLWTYFNRQGNEFVPAYSITFLRKKR